MGQMFANKKVEGKQDMNNNVEKRNLMSEMRND